MHAVVTGSLMDGDPMPSTRQLAGQHGIARSTVVEAYERLCGIGVLVAEQGSGTRVADGARMLLAHQPTPEARTQTTRAPQPRVDLTVPGSGGEQVIDQREWNRAWREAIQPGRTDRPEDELRQHLSAHLRTFRGMSMVDAKLVLRPSLAAVLADIANGLGLRGRSVALEHPCDPRLQRQLVNLGARVHGISVDDEGLRVSALRPDDVAVFVSPARQWPTGVTLSAQRRDELMAWAQRTGGTIIECDQDAEFTYGQAPLPTLYSSAPDGVRVLYVGSSWKLIAPELHVWWLVAPTGFHSLSTDLAPLSPYTSRVLASYIASGALYRQRNRALHLFEERREALLHQLAQVAPGVQVTGAASGTELVLLLPAGCDELRVQLAVERAGFAVSTLGEFAPGQHRQALLVEFGQLPPMKAIQFAGALGQAVS